MEEDFVGHQGLLMMVIVQAVDDYKTLKANGLIENGRAYYERVCRCEKLPRNIPPDCIEDLCDFFWMGRMDALIEFSGMRINSSVIYQHIEPRLWKSLIYKHQKASATSR